MILTGNLPVELPKPTMRLIEFVLLMLLEDRGVQRLDVLYFVEDINREFYKLRERKQQP